MPLLYARGNALTPNAPDPKRSKRSQDFDAPNAKFVCATLGQTQKGAEGNEGKILDAMFAVSDADKYPQFKDDVATVYTHPLSQGGASNSHYGGNAEKGWGDGAPMRGGGARWSWHFINVFLEKYVI